MASKQTITTLLSFDNNAEEAIEFYTAIFQHSKGLSVSTARRVPARREFGPSWQVLPSVLSEL